MNIYVLDGLNGIIGVVNQFQSAIWNVKYYDISDFQMIVPGTPENINLLKEGRYLVRESDITGNTYENVMIISGIDIRYDSDDGYTATVTGKGLKSILSQRIALTQQNFDDKTVGYIITSVVDANFVNPDDSARVFPNFEITPITASTPSIDLQAFYSNIGDWLVEICTTYGLGWDVMISGGKYKFFVYKGTDRSENQSIVPPVVFSPTFDNLLSSEYQKNIEAYKNVAVVVGEEISGTKIIATVGTATGAERYEMYVDGSGVSSEQIITVEKYRALLAEYGKKELANLSVSENVSGEIITNGVYKIDSDFYLGDVVSVKSELGYSASTRLTEVLYSEDENGTQTIGTFSEWGLT